MIGGSIGSVASMDPTGYQAVVASGDVEQMSALILRICFCQGHEGIRQDELKTLALRHIGAGCRDPVHRSIISSSCSCSCSSSMGVLTYRDLVSEISSSKGEQSVHDPVPADSAVENPCGMSNSCCSNLADFIGNVQADLLPSVPQLPPTAAMQNALVEISLQGMELARDLHQELGAVAMFYVPSGPQHFLYCRAIVLVLRHSSDATRGIRLWESCIREEVTTAALAVGDALGRLVASHVPENIYAALLADVELQTSVIKACTEEREHYPQASEDEEEEDEDQEEEDEEVLAMTATTATTSPPGPICNDCPICLSAIEPCDAAMRCAGDGGLHHYFHSDCMLKWVDECRTGLSAADCPICRGQIQFHVQRIEQFLVSEQSAGMAAEDRTFLAQCADRLRATGSMAWGDVFTIENTRYMGGLAAAAGLGFTHAYCCPRTTSVGDFQPDFRSKQLTIAHGVGLAVGLIVRVVRARQR